MIPHKAHKPNNPNNRTRTIRSELDFFGAGVGAADC
jgi:hypothetical protein